MVSSLFCRRQLNKLTKIQYLMLLASREATDMVVVIFVTELKFLTALIFLVAIYFIIS